MIIKNRLVKKFSTIPNAIITDQRITDRALRVYLYLVSKPDGWQVNNADVMNQLNIKSEETLSAAWKCLIESGWINRTHKIADNGKFLGGYDYALNEFPDAENTEPGKNPDPGKTRSSETSGSGENGGHSNKGNHSSIIDNNGVILNKQNLANSEIIWQGAYKMWRNIAKEHGMKFTNSEWNMILGYVMAKPHLPPHQILTNLFALDKWANEGLDIEDALLTGHPYPMLKRPNAKFIIDRFNKRQFGNIVIDQRNARIAYELEQEKEKNAS